MIILEGKLVSKKFGGVKAVTDVDFEVHAGEILGLIGPNGAGKSTMMNLISGTMKPSSGKLIFEGQDITKLEPYKRAKLGISRTFQNMKPFYGLTVLENVCAAAIFKNKDLSVSKGYEVANEMLELVGLNHNRNLVADKLNLEGKKRLELAKALALKPKLLLLDELIAGLSLDQVKGLVEIIQEINRQGVTIIFIEHVMRIVMNLCHRITVLQNGCKIANGVPADIALDARVRSAYLGSSALK